MHAGALAGAEKAHSRSTTIDFKIQRALEENKRKKQKRVRRGGRGLSGGGGSLRGVMGLVMGLVMSCVSREAGRHTTSLPRAVLTDCGFRINELPACRRLPRRRPSTRASCS